MTQARRDPPVTEVAITIGFDDVPLTALDIAEIHRLFPQFPALQHMPTLPSMVGDARPQMIGGEPAILVPDVGQLPRTWFVSSDGKELLQLQFDRLVHNWRRLTPVDAGGAEYPGYEQIRTSFRAEFEVLSGWFAGKEFPQPVPRTCELLYQDAIPLIGEGDDAPIRMSTVLRFYKPETRKMLQGFQVRWREAALPEGQKGFAEVTIGGGLLPDGKPALALQLLARAEIGTEERIDGIFEKIDTLHDKLHEIFADCVADDFRGGGG